MSLISVYCERTDCNYCKSGRCSQNAITIDSDGYCEDYEEKIYKDDDELETN